MFRRIVFAALVHGALLTTAFAAQRVSFVRTIPAAHELPGERIAFIYAMGDNDQVRTFVDILVDRLNRNRAIEVVDATEQRNVVVGGQIDESLLRRLRREHPAEVYVGVNRFTCTTIERSGEGSTYNVDGVREKKVQRWADTVCTSRVNVIDAASGRQIESFEVKGEGTSARSSQLSDEDRKTAAMQAARYAAISAAEAVTPRHVRESIELDERAPAFDEARVLINADRLSELRRRWETMLRENTASAPLHYDFAAVCEALGDLETAQKHYETAQRLSPEEPRYRTELSMFRRRIGAKK